MSVFASAPGKVILLGEYAVLESAPALVMAVNRRARVTLARPAHEGGRWHATIDTARLFMGAPHARKKLGLGSSAAVTVALASARCAARGRPLPSVDALIRMHRRRQDGRGSGVDVAAALHGGVSLYRLDHGAAHCVAARLPQGFEWCCVWSGKPTSTSEFLRRVAAWREREPRGYDAAIADLAIAAEGGAAAILQGDAQALVAAIAEYGRRLARFGRASSLDVVCDEHRCIGDIAAQCGVAYKSCGAGGDMGIAATARAGTLARFRRRLASAGVTTLDLVMDARGVRVRVGDETSSKRS